MHKKVIEIRLDAASLSDVCPLSAFYALFFHSLIISDTEKHCIRDTNAFISDLLKYASWNIDVDDMKECLKTGLKSGKYQETQMMVDTIKDTYNFDYIYVISM